MFQANFFTLLFHFHQKALEFSLLSAIREVSSAYLRLLIFLPAILIPACASSSPAFLMMYSAAAAAAKSLQSYPTLCDPIDCSTPGITGHHQLQELLKLMSIESVMPSNYLILCHHLLLQPSIFPSIRAFSNESVLCIRWPKYWRFSFNISPSNEYSGLISLRMDWLDLLAVQGTLRSLLQHHTSKVSILWCSTFFIVQLSHPYMTTGKTIARTRRTFVGKVMSLLFNTLSRLVITSSKEQASFNFTASHHLQ